jgi:D-glycero-alpha-D-manno-heptose-7-phosphate kinase
MIISRTPFRISFFGGGTDYPAWYRQHGGVVLGGTIDKYCYLSCRYLPPFFEHRIRVIYSVIERCQTIDEIEHPAVRESLRFLNIGPGIEIHHQGDLPARSGMGSSSAFTVGLLHALHALRGHVVSKHQLATEGIHMEQDLLKETVGSQDQVFVAYGGVNTIHFTPSGDISVRPLTVARGRLVELNEHLMLVYTGISRTASQVAGSYVPEIDDRRRQLRTLMNLVEEAVAVLSGRGPLQPFGELLHEGWQEKRSLGGQVSNGTVDEIYAEARAAGAVGGKLLGAGGGGFLLLFVPPERQADVRRRLDRLIHVPFQFEYSGSQIIFYEPEDKTIASLALPTA